MDLYVVRRLTGWNNAQELEATAERSARVGDEMPDRVRWIRSYVLQEPGGEFGTICVYEAIDVVSIHEHARRVGMPGDHEDIFPIVEAVVVRADPVACASSTVPQLQHA